MISHTVALIEQLYIADKPWENAYIFTYVMEIYRFSRLWADLLESMPDFVVYFRKTVVKRTLRKWNNEVAFLTLFKSRVYWF